MNVFWGLKLVKIYKFMENWNDGVMQLDWLTRPNES